MKIGKAIKEIRIALKLSASEVAKKAKVSQGYFSLVENDKAVPSTKVIKKIADAMDVDAPVIVIMGMEKCDTKKGKKRLYDQLKPVIDELIGVYLNAKK